MRRAFWLSLLLLATLTVARPVIAAPRRDAPPFGEEPALSAGSRYPSLFPAAPTVGVSTRLIAVDLSEQQLIAFEGLTPIRAFPVATGDAAHPTITGHYTVQWKRAQIDLIGPDWYYHDVPYVMMFAAPFYIHAAPWRAEFGAPASRGCVTLASAAAAWLYAWADVGTPIVIRW
jgi:lipoprotein-anchoring transpeptidase ErfK/SrfK